MATKFDQKQNTKLIDEAKRLITLGYCISAGTIDKHPAALWRKSDGKWGYGEQLFSSDLTSYLNEYRSCEKIFKSYPNIGVVLGHNDLIGFDWDAKHLAIADRKKWEGTLIRLFRDTLKENVVIEQTISGGLHFYCRYNGSIGSYDYVRLINVNQGIQGKAINILEFYHKRRWFNSYLGGQIRLLTNTGLAALKLTSVIQFQVLMDNLSSLSECELAETEVLRHRQTTSEYSNTKFNATLDEQKKIMHDLLIESQLVGFRDNEYYRLPDGKPGAVKIYEGAHATVHIFSTAFDKLFITGQTLSFVQLYSLVRFGNLDRINWQKSMQALGEKFGEKRLIVRISKGSKMFSSNSFKSPLR